ncbi:Solute carrier family 12 member 8, partial [Armadillidium vulgare]
MSSVQKSVDWSQYSLKNGIKEPTTERSKLKEEGGEEPFYGVGEGEELFSKEEKSKPWWLINILVSERTLFGTWDGVFTSCMANLLGAIVFLRTGWVVAQAGIIQGALIVTTAVIVVASTTLSVSL